MAVVVADTGPINYLVLIDRIDLLPELFDQVFVTQTVYGELTHGDTPEPVRAWTSQPPPWFTLRADPASVMDESTAALDIGERTAIALALAIKADLLLTDDQAAIAAARRQGLVATGTLGVLDAAARRGLIDLGEAFARLKTTSFYYRQGLLDTLLARYAAKS